MGAVELDRMSWPEVRAAIEGGRDTVVLALGATEQHGPHLPLATDALIGDELARRVADRLDAFLAPTVRVGCSAHHIGFAGTMSLEEGTFRRLVGDIVRSLLAGGFRRIVLVPTHGGNFAPLAAAIDDLGDRERARVAALTDLGALFAIVRLGEREHGVPIGEGGLHAGEWETSMLLALEPSLVRMERAEPGYTGDPEAATAAIFADGVASISANGIVGDPARASAAHGERYWREVEEIALGHISAGG